jgi:hypothetical protein
MRSPTVSRLVTCSVIACGGAQATRPLRQATTLAPGSASASASPGAPSATASTSPLPPASAVCPAGVALTGGSFKMGYRGELVRINLRSVRAYLLKGAGRHAHGAGFGQIRHPLSMATRN